MRKSGKRTDDEGLLSLDFIIGFTIFMVALIFVGIMISGLLVHLQSRTIDYDAVAYRTSVVLVEDPGEPKNWQLFDLTYYEQRKEVKRLGMGVEKGYPGILKMNKVTKFFLNSSLPYCSGKNEFCYPSDYREKLIFGDYPYNFNISIKGLGTGEIKYSIGDQVPQQSKYGYIKRIVKIQNPGSSYNITAIPSPDGNLTMFTVRFDFTELYRRIPPYRIDPLSEDMRVYIDFSNPGFTGLNLTGLQVCKYPLIGLPGCIGETSYDNSPRLNVTVDGVTVHEPFPEILSNLTIVYEGGLFPRIGYDEFSSIDTILTFDTNVTTQPLYFYNYSSISLPDLEPAVLEVRIW